MKVAVILAGLAIGVVGCAPGPQPAMGGGTPGAGAPPISNAGGSSQGAPQSANSLPPGDRVNAPLASPTGVVGSTRVR